jgi:hypothetical protein
MISNTPTLRDKQAPTEAKIKQRGEENDKENASNQSKQSFITNSNVVRNLLLEIRNIVA